MNPHQKAYLATLGIVLDPLHFERRKSLIASELNELGLTHQYSIFSPFKKAVLSKITLGKTTPRNDQNISAYLAASPFGLMESIKRYPASLDGLLWRAFYYQVTPTTWVESIFPKRDLQPFYNASTGIALIDAAIRCLKETGMMTNRHRMMCAMYFTKNLGGSWQDGAKFFSKYLQDYDPYLNDGNWIWCSQQRFDNRNYLRLISPFKEVANTDTEWLARWMTTSNRITKAMYRLEVNHLTNLFKRNKFSVVPRLQ